MLKSIEKIPAGTFLVPMLLSALIYTFWPDLFQIGGITQEIFGGAGLNAIIGAICFCAGVGIDIKTLPYVFNRQGVLMIVHAIFAAVLGLGYYYFFGNEGIFGISALAFIVVVSSINPAVYLSLVRQYGSENDQAAFGLMGLFSIPFFPVLLFGFTGSGGIDWMPVISTLVPLVLGVLVGNIDRDFTRLFPPAVPALTALMGWGIGQGINLIESLSAGFGGVILILIFYVVSMPLLFTDKRILNNDGVVGLSMVNVAGLSVSTPAIIAVANTQQAEFMVSAQAQVLMCAVATSIITPILVQRLVNKNKATHKA